MYFLQANPYLPAQQPSSQTAIALCAAAALDYLASCRLTAGSRGKLEIRSTGFALYPWLRLPCIPLSPTYHNLSPCVAGAGLVALHPCPAKAGLRKEGWASSGKLQKGEGKEGWARGKEGYWPG